LVVFLSFVFGFEGINPLYNTGGYNEMKRTVICVLIPVPIPNTAVKHFSGENTSKGKIARCQYLFFLKFSISKQVFAKKSSFG
jgi:hypothetical protein